MKIRAWILAASIVAATASFTAPTAQACAITPDGECMTAVVRSQPSTGIEKHKTTHPIRHQRRHKPPLEP